MSTQPGAFAFKQFNLVQGKGAWKVGTDSVLLGSWCHIDNAKRALDTGTGSGILSLMLAQRNSSILVDAVDISDEAIAEAKENISNSKWASRIQLIHADLMKMDFGIEKSYDRIVCNPPFFPSGITSVLEVRKTSRQGKGFSLDDVPSLSQKYLNADGLVAIVIPASMAYQFIQASNDYGLYVQRRLEVRHHAEAPVSIVLLELSYHLIRPEHQTLILYNDHQPSTAYQLLCENFITV